MNSIAKALTWEMLARSWSIVAYFILANMLPVLVYFAIGSIGINKDDPSMLVMYFAFLPLIVVELGFGIHLALGPPSRLYTLPISNFAIVGSRLLLGGVVLSVEMVVIALAYQALFGIHWPVLSTVLFALVVWSTVQIMIVSTQPTVTSFLISTIPCVGSILWAQSRHGGWFSQPSNYWNEIAVLDVLIVSALCLGSYFTAVKCLARSRCGVYFPKLPIWNVLLKVGEYLERVFLKQPERFTSRLHAHQWHEWVQKGLALPLALICLMTIFALLLGIESLVKDQPIVEKTVNSLEVLGILIPFLGGLVGLFGGLFQTSGKRQETLQDLVLYTNVYSMNGFYASLPLTDTQFSWTTLKTFLKSLAITLSLWSVAYFGAFSCAQVTGQLPTKMLYNELGWWFWVIVIVGPWVSFGNVLTIVQSGKTAFWLGLLCVLPTTYFVVLLILRALLPPAWIEVIHQTSLGVVSSSIIVAAIWAFATAWNRSLVPTRVVIASIVCLAGLIFLGCYFHPDEIVIRHWSHWGMVVAGCCLVVTPLAFGPIAISYNRHRP